MNKDGFEINPESGSNTGSINVKANDTGFIIICGNGFSPIPQTSQYIVSFKNSSGDTTYGFRFYMV